MRDPLQVFDEACAEVGCGQRLFPIPRGFSGVENLRAGMEKAIARSSQHTRNLPKLHLDFVDNGELNAFAQIREGYGLIAVFTGSFLRLSDFFNRVAAHPNTLPLIGDPSRETIHPQQHSEPLRFDFADTIASRQNNGREVQTIQPADPVRADFAKQAFWRCMQFLNFHEFAHIAYGHLGYLQFDLGLSFLLESNKRSNRPLALDPILRQTLERDADWLGANLSIEAILRRFYENQPVAKPDWINTPEIAMFLWTYAICGLFYLWGMETDMSRMNDAFYLPVAWRMNDAIIAGLATVEVMLPDKLGELNKVANTACHQLLVDAGQLNGGRMPAELKDLGSVMVGQHQVADTHFKRLYSMRGSIHSSLQRYAFMRLPEPPR